jgi:hypothetical protein
MIGLARNQFIQGASLPFDSSWVNFVQSGFILPTSGTIASRPAMTAGVAYIEGAKVSLSAVPLVLTASRDNYIDINRFGAVTVSPVVIAATAPAIPVNAMRIGFVTTNATNVTGSTSNAFDNQGNWMANTSRAQACRLRSNTLQGSGGAEISVNFPDADVFDNAGLHDPVTNNSRITFPAPGVYFLSCAIAFSAPQTPLSSFSLYLRLNGATEETTFPQDSRGTAGAVINMQTSGFVVVPPSSVPQYAEFRFIPNGVATATLAAAWLQCVRVA